MGLSGFAVSPHTGARLETHRHTGKQTPAKMPPTRGHDLKQPLSCTEKPILGLF